MHKLQILERPAKILSQAQREHYFATAPRLRRLNSPVNLPQVELDQAAYLSGPAGTITVHNCRSVHGSPPNLSAKPRPLLLCAYSVANALPLTSLTARGKYTETLVRGAPARWARFDPRPVLMPPDWSKTGYTSIFAYQQDDAGLAAQGGKM